MQSVCRCSCARATTARCARATPSASSSPAARTCSASPVSTTSEEVRPWWNQRPSGPSVSATASTNAAVSWCSVASSSATRSGLGGRAFSRIDRADSAGTNPSSAPASSAASSTSSQRTSFSSSDQILAISGREYRAITASSLEPSSADQRQPIERLLDLDSVDGVEPRLLRAPPFPFVEAPRARIVREDPEHRGGVALLREPVLRLRHQLRRRPGAPGLGQDVDRVQLAGVVFGARRPDRCEADDPALGLRYPDDLRPACKQPSGEILAVVDRQAVEHLGRESVTVRRLPGADVHLGDLARVGGLAPPDRHRLRMRIASTAALRELSTPTVATGTPGGSCTIESSASSPSRTLFSERSGTPITGRSVCAATTPGSAAARPAPAISTLIPRSRAVDAYSATAFGSRCAERTSSSYAIPWRSSSSTASCIRSRSDSEPTRIPTTGSAIGRDVVPVARTGEE